MGAEQILSDASRASFTAISGLRKPREKSLQAGQNTVKRTTAMDAGRHTSENARIKPSNRGRGGSKPPDGVPIWEKVKR